MDDTELDDYGEPTDEEVELNRLEEEKHEEALTDWLTDLIAIEAQGYDIPHYITTEGNLKRRSDLPKEHYGYVYKVTNKTDGKVYIGRTTHNPIKRWNEHSKTALKGNGSDFHHALRICGEEAFTWETIATADSKNKLYELEDRFINSHHARNPAYGYNRTGGAHD
jgi:hypothetical protein